MNEQFPLSPHHWTTHMTLLAIYHTYSVVEWGIRHQENDNKTKWLWGITTAMDKPTVLAMACPIDPKLDHLPG